MQLKEMELIYLYVERFGDFIYQQELLLSNNFDVSLKNKKLIVRRKENHSKDFYGDKIKNLSVLVGKNGSGKTTILDILGMNRNDRLNNQEFSKKSKNEYFMLYYLGNSEEGDLFGIEVTSDSLLQNMIENYDHAKDDERYDKSKRSIGKVYKYINDTFISTGRHFFDYRINNVEVSSLIKYVYIGEEYRYSFRNNSYGLRYYQDPYALQREKMPYSSVFMKYETILDCINKELDIFEFDKLIIRFKDDIDYTYELEKEKFDKYRDLILEIEKNLYIFNSIRFKRVFAKNSIKREQYILDLYSRYIMDMLVVALYTTCYFSNKRKKYTAEIGFKNSNQLIEYVSKLEACDCSVEQLGKAEDFEKELKVILDLSKKLLQIYKNEPKQYLKILMRYINSRLHEPSEYEYFKYVEAFEKIIDILYKIPGGIFLKDGFKIIIKNNNQHIEEFLKEYSHYCELERSQEECYTNMNVKFGVSFQMLSEGEERFIDFIAKIKESIVKKNVDAKLFVLLMDEPDQSLHPEWARCFVDIITRAINSIHFNGNVQVIMSTHSPYLLSDILPSGIFMLNRDLTDRQLSITSGNNGKLSGLGANIYDLMKNEFFMNNTVGEFATKKIKQYIRKIDELDLEKGCDLQDVEFFVSQVGDPFIKNAMQKRLSEKQHAFKLKETSKKLLELITDERDRENVMAYLRTIEEQK